MQIDNELSVKIMVRNCWEKWLNCILLPLLLCIIMKPFPKAPFWARNPANRNPAEIRGNLHTVSNRRLLTSCEVVVSFLPSVHLSSHALVVLLGIHTYSLLNRRSTVCKWEICPRSLNLVNHGSFQPWLWVYDSEILKDIFYLDM